MPVRIGPRRPRRLFLSEWREYRDLTQEQVGGRLGVAGMTISRWERQKGSHKPNIDVLAALAEVYEIEPEDFYHPPGRPTPNSLLRDQEPAVVEQGIKLLQAIRR